MQRQPVSADGRRRLDGSHYYASWATTYLITNAPARANVKSEQPR